MKIFYLMSSFEGGGAAATLTDILTLLQKDGHEVHVIACEARDRKLIPEIKKAHVSYSILKCGTMGKLIKLPLFLWHLIICRPNLIWTSHSKASFIGQVAGKLLHIPVVSWKNLARSRNYSFYTKNIPILWIADSLATADALKNDLKIPSSKVKTWPLFQCAPMALLPKRPLNNRPLYLGSLGRLHSSKQYDILIFAIDHLKKEIPGLAHSLQVFIAGDGPQEKYLKTLIAERNLDDIIHLKGFVKNIIPFLDQLDLYVQPSFIEGLCLGVHEAMSRGLPVIATSTGELSYIIKTYETGILLNHKEGDACIKDCAKAITFFLKNPHKCQDYGAYARQLIWAKYPPGSFMKNGKDILTLIKKIMLFRS